MSEWQKCFAWRPVRTEDGKLRWLCRLERRDVAVEDDLWHETDHHWSYRDIPDYSR